jgi:hypothetical protein
MSFTAAMPGSGRVGGFRIPTVHGKIGISTSDHEPMDGIGGNESTDFTSEFLQRCHALSSLCVLIPERKQRANASSLPTLASNFDSEPNQALKNLGIIIRYLAENTLKHSSTPRVEAHPVHAP